MRRLPDDSLIDLALVERARACMADMTDEARRKRMMAWLRRYMAKRRRLAITVADAVAASDVICQFTSMEDWICHARSWLGGVSGTGSRYKRRELSVCIDAKGRLCERGEHFQRAAADGAYPVTAYRRQV